MDRIRCVKETILYARKMTQCCETELLSVYTEKNLNSNKPPIRLTICMLSIFFSNLFSYAVYTQKNPLFKNETGFSI